MKQILVVFIVAVGVLSPAQYANAAPASPPNPCVQGIRQAWPTHLHTWAIRISWRESRWQQAAVNRSPLRASGCMQLLPMYARPYLRAARCTNLLNGYCNTRAAYQLYKTAGRRPWATR